MNSNSGRSENVNAVTNANTGRNAGTSPESVVGVWGGLHINLEVNESGAEITYDCAHGSITEKIVPDQDGKFVVKGLHVQEHPGPVREGDEGKGEAATYSGSIDGETMTLTVTLPAKQETVGTFTLTKGKTGRIRKCA